jgi:acetylglutamate synthase
VCRLMAVADGLHISVASPLNLLAELFTVKGAGCLIRRGARIRRYDAIGEVDRGRLLSLLENSFGRQLIRPECLDEVSSFYVDDDYRCAAVLEPYAAYMYLSKFAVQREARGEGMAQELWRTITGAHAAVFWRSRLRNPFNQWYDRQADGMHTEGDWKVYWRGVARADIPVVIAAALARPLDFAAETDACGSATQMMQG